MTPNDLRKIKNEELKPKLDATIKEIDSLLLELYTEGTVLSIAIPYLKAKQMWFEPRLFLAIQKHYLTEWWAVTKEANNNGGFDMIFCEITSSCNDPREYPTRQA